MTALKNLGHFFVECPSVLVCPFLWFSDFGRDTVEMVQCFQCVIVHYINVLEIVVSRVICPQDVRILISGTCNILPCLAKGTSQMGLSEWFWDGEIILEYLGRSNIIRDPDKEKGAREVRGGDMMKEAEVGSCIFSSVSAWGILSMVAL